MNAKAKKLHAMQRAIRVHDKRRASRAFAAALNEKRAQGMGFNRTARSQYRRAFLRFIGY